MQIVPIQAIPNQDFSITLQNNLYQIGIHATNGVMSVSMSINGDDIMDNIRAVAGSPVIPSQYLEQGNGNFLFLTANYQLPDYTQFNLTQSLAYFSAAELISFRTPQLVFSPIAALPLRYAPQGYVAA